MTTWTGSSVLPDSYGAGREQLKRYPGDEIGDGVGGAGQGRPVDGQGSILGDDADVVVECASWVGRGDNVGVSKRRYDGQLSGRAGGSGDETQLGTRGVGKYIGGESEIGGVDGGGDVGQRVLAAAGINRVGRGLRGGRADQDAFRGPVAQLDGHRARERVGGVGDRIKVAAGGLGEVVHDHRMRARRCRGRGRSKLEYVGVGAGALLLRQDSLKIGERAHVVGEIREQRAEARDCRVLAFE